MNALETSCLAWRERLDTGCARGENKKRKEEEKWDIQQAPVERRYLKKVYA